MKGEIFCAQGALEEVSQNFRWGGEQGCRLVVAGIPYMFEPSPFSSAVENTWPQCSSCCLCKTSWQRKQVTCERLPKGNAYIHRGLAYWKMYKKEKFLYRTEDGLGKISNVVRLSEPICLLTPHCIEQGYIGTLPACTSSFASGQKPVKETKPCCRAESTSGPSPSAPAPFPVPLLPSSPCHPFPQLAPGRMRPLEYVPLTTLPPNCFKAEHSVLQDYWE